MLRITRGRLGLVTPGLIGLAAASFGGRVEDFPGAPPLDGAADAWASYHGHLVGAFHDALAAQDWERQAGGADGVVVTHRRDPVSGCPWVKGEAVLRGCSLAQAAAFFVTDLAAHEREWDATLVDRAPLRSMLVASGQQEIFWHVEHDSAFLAQRAYYLFDGWRWNSPDEVEDAASSVHAALAPPAGTVPANGSRAVRSAQWAWKRLSRAGLNITRYEVMWLSDVKGWVPCDVTVSGQAASMRREVSYFRKVFPDPAESPAGQAVALFT